MKVKNPLQGYMWKLLLVNTLACGVEACLAVGTLYIPPLLLQAGMEEHSMTMAMALSPLLGLIIIPTIGSASDSWQSRFGRRRPFIWMLSLGVLLGTQLIPHTWYISGLLFPQHSHTVEIALLAGAVCVLDICGQGALTILMALLSDLFPKEEENRKAFSINSLMTSLGGCLGFLLPAVDWSKAPIAKYLGGEEAFVCIMVAVFFLGCLLTTTFIQEQSSAREGERNVVVCKPLKCWRSRSCLHFLPCQLFAVRLYRCVSSCASTFPQMFAAFLQVPPVIWRLFLAETFNWMAVMTIMLFFGDFMGEGLYKGVPSADPESQERIRFNEGVRMASLGLLLQAAVSVLCSSGMDRWVALMGSRVVYTSGAALLMFVTAVMSVTDSVVTVTAMAALSGYSLSVFQVVPRTLMCLYHSNKQVFFSSSKPRPPQRCKSDDIKATNSSGPATLNSEGYTRGRTLRGLEPSVGSNHVSLLVGGGDRSEADCSPDTQRGMCFDMAVLDGAYLLSQVVPALFIGAIVELAHSVRAYMVAACCFSLMALLCSSRVVYSHEDLHR